MKKIFKKGGITISVPKDYDGLVKIDFGMGGVGISIRDCKSLFIALKEFLKYNHRESKK